ncbi:MAG: exodeoxyribonuclease V subunit gamma, partial [Syntrophales bacterium]|nr:exodeoxyribonuclease V subunit gamma [Syntrophales bacterium]
MPGIYLYTSNRTELLVERLGDVMTTPLPDPFQAETVIVQSRGMERWLSLEMAQRLGICAHVTFPHPVTFVQRLFRDHFPDLPDVSPYEPHQLVWTIMAVLPPLVEEWGLASLKRYMGDRRGEIKHYQLSLHIAHLFDRYLLFRPEMIMRWDKGEDEHWQAVLWQQVVAVLGPWHRVALYRRWHEREGWKTAAIPPRLS